MRYKVPAVIRLFAASLFAWCAAGGAQNYPVKPVRIITTQPGGPNDLAARLIAQSLTGGLGQQVIVDNRAGGVIATEAVARAASDGYTLLLNGSIVWLLPLMRDNTPWDMNRDFAPVALVMRAPSVLVVHPSLPIKTVRELVALAKAKPGQLNLASAVSGSANHLTGELFKTSAGVNIVTVPYKGGGRALTSLIAGESQIMFGLADAVAPHIKSGRARAIGATSPGPSALFPGVPPISATVPGYESVVMFGVLAPAATSAAILSRLNQEIGKVLARAEVKERFMNAGAEIGGGSAGEFADAIKAETARMGKVIKEANIRAD